MKQIKYLLYIALAISPLLLQNTLLADELPDLGSRSKTILSPEKEKLLGKEFIKAIKRSMEIVDDPIINQYIQKIGNKLAANSNSKNRKFKFFVIADPTINAFAGPDAYIGINSGTILAVHSDSELAAIMAHEIAHVSQFHIPRLIATAKNAQLIAIAGMLAGIIVGASTNNNSIGNIANSTTMTSVGGATQHMISSIRMHEAEADSIGIKILQKSGFDPEAMPKVFAKMQKLNLNYKNEIPSYLCTHPMIGNRVADATNRAKQNQKNTHNPQILFNLIKIRTEALTAKDPFKTIRFFENELKKSKQKNNIYLQYGLALAKYKNLQLNSAAKITNQLQQKLPNELLFQMLAAKLATTNKDYTKALETLKQSLTTNHDYYPLIIQYTQTLITAKHYQTANEFIKNRIKKDPDNAELYFLLSEAYAGTNKRADAYLAKAKAYELLGYNRQAAVLLKQALKIPKLNTTNKAIISARIEHFKKIIVRGNL